MPTPVQKITARSFFDFIGAETTRLFLLSFLSGAALFFVEVGFIFVLQSFLFSIGLISKDVFSPPLWYPQTLSGNIIALSIFGALRSLAYFSRAYLTAVVSYVFARHQREVVVEFCLENAKDISTKDSITLFTENIAAVGLFLQQLLTVCLTGTTAVFLLGAGMYVAPRQTMIGIVALGIISLPLKRYDRLVTEAGNGLVREWDSVSTTLLNGIKQNFFLKIHGKVEEEKNKAIASLRSYLGHQKQHSFTFAVRYSIPSFLGVPVLGVITYLSIRYFHTQVTVLISFFYLFIRLVQSASEAYSSLGTMHLFSKQIYPLFEKYEFIKKTRIEKASQIPLSEAEQSRFNNILDSNGANLSIKELFFHYREGEPWILENLSLNVSHGDCVVIMGKSGVGKSTLLSLILGVLSPTKGKISVNESEIEKFQALLYRHVGYIGPDPYLVPGTIRENLMYGLSPGEYPSEEKIFAALQVASAKDFVAALPKGLETYLNEAAALSTGQKQRISITRALLREPKILVLDEATSNLDSESERVILASLRNMREKITTIVVTHRPSFREIATKVIELQRD